MLLGGQQGVLHEHSAGHGTNAAGNRSDGGCDLLNILKVHVAAQLLGFLIPVDADVDDRRARLDHIGLDELRPADSRDENIGVSGDFSQILRLGMADGDGAVLLQQQKRHRQHPLQC